MNDSTALSDADRLQLIQAPLVEVLHYYQAGAPVLRLARALHALEAAAREAGLYG